MPDRTSRRSLLADVILVAMAVSAPSRTWADDVLEGNRPNFLIIFADDLGYNDLGCYGARDPGIKTPNLDRMADEGVRFTDWFSACSVCAPSRAALLTGRYPMRCGMPVCANGSGRTQDWAHNIGLQQSEITIAELLGPLGYATAWYGKSHLGHHPKFLPLRHGFDEYYGSIYNFPVGGTCPVLEGDAVVEPEVRFEDIHLPRDERMLVYWAGPKLGGIRDLDQPILFDLAEDIGETTDVAAKHPEVVDRLLRLAAEARKELGDWNTRGTDQKKLLDYPGDPNKPFRVKKGEVVDPADQHPNTMAINPQD